MLVWICVFSTARQGCRFDSDTQRITRYLFLQGHPFTQLGVQWRMRPEIADLLRDKVLYPTLLDAEKTKNRENVKGMNFWPDPFVVGSSLQSRAR